MKKLSAFLFCVLLLLSVRGQAQCSGQFTLVYPSGSGTATVNINNGTQTLNASYCPSAAGQSVVVTQVAAGTLTLTRTVNAVTTTLQAINPTTANTAYTFPLPTITQQASYQITSTVACNNNKTIAFSFTLAPTLALTATLTTVCSGGASVLTATGSTSGSYTWTAPGMASVTNAGTLSVTPAQTTTYTVTAPTSCSTTTQQLVTVAVPALTTSAAPTICAGSSTTLTASSTEPAATFAWTRAGNPVGAGASLAVAPSTTTTYRVTSSNPSGCSGTSFRDVVVTVAAQTLAVSPAAPSIVNGSSATLTASTNLSGASYVWHTGGANGPVVGSAAALTVTPSQTTTYTVVCTAGACSSTQNVTVTVTTNLGPLPVELMSFEAAWLAPAPLLTWATASERDNAYFDVERSLDGRRFEAVARVAGAGSSTRRTDYRFLDAEARPKAGSTCYYRLRQVDHSGEASYSAVRTLRCGTPAAGLAAVAFPNPCDARTALHLDLPQAGPLACTLHDLLGRELAAGTFELPAGPQELAWPVLRSLPKGVYLLRVGQGTQHQVLRLQQP